MSSLLSVRNLRVTFHSRGKTVEAVRGINLEIGKERVAIVGESGSGKSVAGRAILGVTPPSATVTADHLSFNGIRLDGHRKAFRAIRGRGISMIMQDPKFSLNPVMTVGRQIAEAFVFHHGASTTEARRRVINALAEVKIREPERVFRLYPHEISGGMGQRVMIAMMLVPEPKLLIADEPTSALDVTVQLSVLAILDELVRERGMGLIFITHDLNLVTTFCDRIHVMYRGRILENLDASQLMAAKHPYTRGLIGAAPSFDSAGKDLPVLQRDPRWLNESIAE